MWRGKIIYYIFQVKSANGNCIYEIYTYDHKININIMAEAINSNFVWLQILSEIMKLYEILGKNVEKLTNFMKNVL